MHRPATALAALALALVAGPAGAAPSGGRVVRVERHTLRGIGTPRYCQFAAGTLAQGNCFGQPVSPGEVITIVSTTAVVALLRVTHVTPDQTCGTSATWLVEGDLDEPARVAPNAMMLGVVDGGLDPRRAHVVPIDGSPSGRAGDADYYAFDTDGNGTVDLMFDHYMCDAQGQPSPTMAAQCFETWTTQAHAREPHRLRLDIVPQC